MDYEFNQNGYISVKYDISYINATFSEDREDLPGVCRITGIEIECDGDIPDEILSDVQSTIFNHFADKEYFSEDPNWRKQAEEDISDYTGVSSVNADWE